MKIKTTYVIVFLFVIILTSANIFINFEKRDNHIRNLNLIINVLKKKNEKLEISANILIKAQKQNLPSKYILYYPKNACSVCLEDVLLFLSKKPEIWNNLLVYMDDKKGMGLIEYLIDAYNLKFDLEFGVPLFEKKLQDIIFINNEENSIENVLVIEQNDTKNLEHLIVVTHPNYPDLNSDTE